MKFMPKLPELKGRRFGVRVVSIGAVSFLVAGAIIGGALGWLAQPNPTSTAEYKAMSEHLHQQLSNTKSNLVTANNQAATDEARYQKVMTRESALKDGERS